MGSQSEQSLLRETLVLRRERCHGDGHSHWRPTAGPPYDWAPTPAITPQAIPGRNSAAVVGATLGSVSLFMSVLPIIGVLAWVLAPIGLVSSTAGLLVGMSRRVGRFGATWGLLTSGLALLICAAWVALLLAI